MAIGATLEGNRPLLVEVQALVTPATYGTPQRSSTGFDAKRLQMLLAVLEKRAGLRLGQHDVFLNIAGGLRLDDPAPGPGRVRGGGLVAQRRTHCRQRSFWGRSGPERRSAGRGPARPAPGPKPRSWAFGRCMYLISTAKGWIWPGFGLKVYPVSRLDEVLAGLFD